eukprot:356675-Chlamydomonas_euryale.AAC.6
MLEHCCRAAAGGCARHTCSLTSCHINHLERVFNVSPAGNAHECMANHTADDGGTACWPHRSGAKAQLNQSSCLVEEQLAEARQRCHPAPLRSL